MSANPDVRGVYVIAPTPFQVDGRVDEASADRMTDFFVQCGVTGITVLGQMGEAPKLEHQEALAFASRVIRRASVPVIVGVSSAGFAALRTLSRAVIDRGAAAVMIAPPPSLKTDDQIVTYYRQAAEAIGEDVPFVVQDFPLTFSVVMTPAVIRRIVMENPSCIMLKHEDWPGLDKISALRSYEREGSMRHISIFCGNGGIFLDFEVERGADGEMTGECFPDMLLDLVRHTAAGRRDASHDLCDAHLPLTRYEQQPSIGLAVRTYVLMSRGILASDTQRRPATSLSKAARDEVNYLLRRLARHDERARLTSLQEPH